MNLSKPWKKYRWQTKDDIEAIQSLEQVEAKEEEQEQAEQEAESKKEPYIYYILSFAKLADLVAFAKTVTFEMETSELYKMNERYYLTILVDIENHPSPYPAWLLARMREFADDSDISRSVLQEYGQVLMNHDAVLNLTKDWFIILKIQFSSIKKDESWDSFFLFILK